jgi:hypothetical protein
MGERLRDESLPRHDRALEILDAAAARVAAGDRQGVHPRSEAHLLLTAYWTAMSAFHLEALSIYALEIERFIPEEMRGHVSHILVTYIPTIRLSDCLEAYDGRRLPLAKETDYVRWTLPDTPGFQGNLLKIPEDDPNYRAQRELASVLLHLDRRLAPRAVAMIDRARAVMGAFAQTGWGWSTYYSEAYTFVFKPAEVLRGHRPASGESMKPPPRPTTPRGPTTRGDGSTPTGPTSGG